MIGRLRVVLMTIAVRGLPWAARILLVALALATRLPRWLRRISGRKPRLVWGPMPIVSIKYWSAAVRQRGYRSRTHVDHVYSINARADFDTHSDEVLGDGPLSNLARPYTVLAWLIWGGDVFLSFLDGGFLRGTPLRDEEGRLLKLAGIKLICFPYGADIAVPGHIGVAEERLLKDYPVFAELAETTRRRVDWFCRWSDVVIRNYQFGYLPRHDLLWPTMLAIDTDEWSSAGPRAGADGRDGEVVVLHAPNHRNVKGTDALIEAIESMRADGIEVGLDLIEKRPNQEVRDAIRECDIIADQFIAGYAMLAIEGLAAARPVMSTLGWMDPEVRHSNGLRDCPIVEANVETVEDKLRTLVQDPERRRRLGAEGLKFAHERHSLAAAGANWEKVIEAVWRGDPTPRELPEEAG